MGQSTTEHHTRQTHTLNPLQDITRKMSWVMVMGLFDLMAESGPGDGKSTLMNNLFNETVCQTGQSENSGKISKKQNKQIRNYTNHNPVVHLGRNEEQDFQQAVKKLDCEQADSCFFDQEEEEEVAEQDNNPVKMLDCEQADSCFFDQEEEEVAEQDKKMYK